MMGLAVDVGLENPVNAGAGLGGMPVVEVRPELIGQGTVGAIVQATLGEWSGTPAPVLTLEWLRDGQPIPGQTAVTYEIQPGDAGAVLSACITAQNTQGVSRVCSPLLPVWPNQTVPGWRIQGVSPSAMAILRAPGPPDLPEVSGGAGLELT